MYSITVYIVFMSKKYTTKTCIKRFKKIYINAIIGVFSHFTILFSIRKKNIKIFPNVLVDLGLNWLPWTPEAFLYSSQGAAVCLPNGYSGPRGFLSSFFVKQNSKLGHQAVTTSRKGSERIISTARCTLWLNSVWTARTKKTFGTKGPNSGYHMILSFRYK